MRKVLVVCVALSTAQCASTPTVEDINAQRAKWEASCKQKGYAPGTQDFQTCMSLAQSQELSQPLNNAMAIGGAASAIGVGAMLLGAFSDIRLKHNIVRVGQLPNGIALYRFRYNWSDEEFVGVMAQEVRRVVPKAVIEGPDGYLRVNYDLVGFKLMNWQEWTALPSPFKFEDVLQFGILNFPYDARVPRQIRNRRIRLDLFVGYALDHFASEQLGWSTLGKMDLKSEVFG
jgi:hypothetical protein